MTRQREALAAEMDRRFANHEQRLAAEVVKPVDAIVSIASGWRDSSSPDAFETIASTRVIASDSVLRQTSYVLTAPGSDVTLIARFDVASDDGEITANVEDEYEVNGPWSLALDIDSLSLPSVTVKGLPTGLKFDAKTLTMYFGKSGTVKTLTGENYGLGEGESITMTIKPNGTVTLKGVFDTGAVKNDRSVYYTATGSAVVCVTSYDPFVGQVFVYFAPNANKNFSGYVRIVQIDEYFHP